MAAFKIPCQFRAEKDFELAAFEILCQFKGEKYFELAAYIFIATSDKKSGLK
ncbi:MAG TPA: hypothetical protein K8V35_09715 [Aliicoccus persicus]|uniref:Uncharacterized protein n=1 Tax=Aliicoccus persicus TaxID=930138 RepID=A0A921DZJ7_9STAP|nr:hypothetical protein [Aliicoccus persicus]